MAAALVLLAGVLHPGWCLPPQFGRTRKSVIWGSMRPLQIQDILTEITGVECSHHSECHSDCCLIDLDTGSSVCAPKAKMKRACLPQTKGATNIICPCQWGLSCISKDRLCPRQCHII